MEPGCFGELMSKPIADVGQYIERNFPFMFPDTKARFKAYIECLLSSSDVNSLLDAIAAYTNPGLESELISPMGDSSFFFHRELHPLAHQYRDLRYQVVLAYSRYFKDLTLFNMIGDWFLDGKAEISYGGLASWPVVSTMDEPWSPCFDQTYTMDMYDQSLPVLMFRMFYVRDDRLQGSLYEDLVASIKRVEDLMILVTPARVPVLFHTVPSYYVGMIPFKFDSDIDSGNLYVEGDGVSANPNRPFYLVPDGEVTELGYEGDLEFDMDGGDLHLTSGSFLTGLTLVSSPFNDEEQLEIIAGLNVEDLGRRPDSEGVVGYYYSVLSNVTPQRYFIFRAGRRLTILLDCPTAINRVVVFSNHPELSDIVMEFDPDSMPRYAVGPVPLFSVRVVIDFDVER
jgi:hypothetical protein